MQFNMALSNNRKILLASIATFILLSILFLYIEFSADSSRKHKSNNGKETLLIQLLHQADSTIGNDPDQTEKNTSFALNLSVSEKLPKYTIQAFLILGRIKQIKGDTDSALYLFKKAKKLASEKSFLPELCAAKIKIGEIIYDHGNYDSAYLFFHEVQEIAIVNHLEPELAYALYYIGKYNETKGHFAAAKNFYNQAIDLCRKNKDYRLLVLILPSRGKNFISEGKLNLALQCYQEAFQLSKQLNDQLLFAETSSHLGSLYLQMDQFDKALEFDKKAVLFRSNMKNPEGLAKSYNNIGKAFHELKQKDSALFYYENSLSLCKKAGYKKGIVKALTNIGKLYLEENNFKDAYFYLDTSFVISLASGYDIGIAEASLGLANLYQNTGKVLKAITYYQLSLSKISNTNYDEMMENIYKGLFECYQSTGDISSALKYHIRLLDTEKKLLNVENNRQLAMLNISYDVERREKDNQVLRADNELKELLIKRNSTFIWLVIVALVFTIALCISIYNRLYEKKKANQLLEALNYKITNQNSELELLNKELENSNREKDKLFSIISHELRNPLYWFQNLSEVLSKKFKEMPAEKVQKSLSALDESAKNAFHLMDNLLQWSRSKLNRIHPKKSVLNLRELITDACDMYSTILSYKEIIFYNNIKDSVSIYADADLFCCVIRNLISNSVKYTPSGGSLSIDYTDNGEIVTVIVQDSGTGICGPEPDHVFSEDILSMPGLMQEKGSGLGLKLCKEFVEMNGGKIWVERSDNKGTCFSFTVPVHSGLNVYEPTLKVQDLES